MSESPHRGPRTLTPEAANAVTLPSDPELANAPTVVANTVATDGRRKRSDPFTLISGESISPQVDAGEVDIDTTEGVKRYERGAVIGAGGMGEVRLHTDRRIGRRVAKKTLHSTLDSSTARRRFLREARVQGQLEHPSIVPVYDLDLDEQGRPFFTMKRVRGMTLERVLERLRAGDVDVTKRFSRRKLLTAFAQVCFTIDYAHTRGVLHRDLKPGNIMLGDFGEVYVLDWGLAKVIGEEDVDADAETMPGNMVPVRGASAALTRRDSLLGTPAYMAPEQLRRDTHEVDARSDIFALGAILFEIVTRTPLRTATEVPEILRQLDQEDGAHPSDRVPDVAPEIDEICARTLARDPDARPARARDLAEAVERFLDGEQDANLRKELAARHADAARRRFTEEKRATTNDPPPAEPATPSTSTTTAAPPARVDALRETMKALALDPENEGAQTLLVDLLTDVSGEIPEQARRELAVATDHARAQGARMGTFGMLLWLAIFPAMVAIGVRSWPPVLVLAGITAVGAGFVYWMSKQPSYGIVLTSIMGVFIAAIVAMTSCYLGPFAVVPTCAATASILFTTHATRRERWFLSGIVSAGAMAPYVAEVTGLFPRAYAFEADRIIVFARAIELPEGATTAAMAYSTLSFIIFAAVLLGRIRDALQESEQRHFLQAWYLRELFPARAARR